MAGTALAVIATTVLSGFHPAASGAISALQTPFIGPANCGECANCLGGHTAGPVEDGDIGSLHSWCLEMVGCTGHPTCSESSRLNPPPASDACGADQHRLLDGAHSGLAAFVSDYPDRVHVDTRRNALQVEGCAPGVISVSIMLAPGELAHIGDRTAGE